MLRCDPAGLLTDLRYIPALGRLLLFSSSLSSGKKLTMSSGLVRPPSCSINMAGTALIASEPAKQS